MKIKEFLIEEVQLRQQIFCLFLYLTKKDLTRLRYVERRKTNWWLDVTLYWVPGHWANQTCTSRKKNQTFFGYRKG